MSAIAPPEAPRAVPDILRRASGKVTSVATGNAGALQAALDARQPGERIQVDPTQPMVGNFLVNGMVIGAMPMLTSSRADIPLRMITPNRQPVLDAEGAVGGLRLENIDGSADPAVTDIIWNLFLLGGGAPQSLTACPRGFVFDRVNVKVGETQQVLRGLGMFGRDIAYINGTMRGVKCHGFDSQAICGGPGPGPFLIRDADLEAASENIMFGGTGVDGPDMVPQDITIERVILRKRLDWKDQGWNIKNHLEFKSAKRVRVRGLHCINCWTDGQVGRSVVVTPRDVGAFPYIVTQDIDIEGVLIEDVNSAFALMGNDDNHQADPEALHTSRIRFANWVARINPGGKCFDIAAASYDVELDRMTWVAADGGLLYATTIVGGTVTRLKTNKLITWHGNFGWSGASGEGNRVASLLPSAEWGTVLEVGPEAQALPGAPYLPGPLLAEPDAMKVFVDLGAKNYRTKPDGPGAGLGGDPDTIAALLAPPPIQITAKTGLNIRINGQLVTT